VRFCARASDLNGLGAFFCNSQLVNPELGKSRHRPIGLSG
jgi:hypothetical protein